MNFVARGEFPYYFSVAATRLRAALFTFILIVIILISFTIFERLFYISEGLLDYTA